MSFATSLDQKTYGTQIPYGEVSDVRTIIRGNDVQEAVRTVEVQWSQASNFVKDVLAKVAIGQAIGPITISPYGVQSSNVVTRTRYKLNRFRPEQHPRYPQLYAVACEEVEGQGVPNTATDAASGTTAMAFRDLNGVPNQTSTGGCKIKITYRTLPFSLNPVGVTNAAINTIAGNTNFPPVGVPIFGIFESCRWTSLKIKSAVQSYQLKGGIFWPIFVPVGQQRIPITENDTIQIPQIHLSYTWHQVPFVSGAAILMQGCTNLYPFDLSPTRSLPFAPFNYPIGTVLYKNFEMSDHYYMADGTPVVDVVFNFVYQSIGWNCVFRPSSGLMTPVYRGIAAQVGNQGGFSRT